MQTSKLRAFTGAISASVLISVSAWANEISDNYLIASQAVWDSTQVAALPEEKPGLSGGSPFDKGGYLSRAPVALSPDGRWQAQVAQQNGVTVTGRQRRGALAPWFMFSLAYAYTVASVATQVTQIFPSSSNVFEGDDIDADHSSIALNLRLTLAGLANIANWANATGNVGNVANAANLANFGPRNCYVGLEMAIAFAALNSGFNRQIHFGTAADTFLRLRERGMLFPYIGCTMLVVANGYGYLNLHAGPLFRFRRIIFESDETSGGGNIANAEDSRTSTGGAIGVEYNHRLPNSVGLAAAGLQLAFLASYNPALSIAAATTTLSNFSYRARVAATWYYMTRLGFFMNF